MSEAQERELAELLNWARDEGTSHIEQIVAENPTRSPLSPSVRDSYLRSAIEYRLSDAHERGLREFARRLDLPFPRLLKV